MTGKNSAARPGVLGTLGAGLTAAEHAAIALKVPNSGTDWLDAMIRESRRRDAAEKIAAALATGNAGMLGDRFSAYAKGDCNAVIADRANVLAAALTEKDPQP